MVFLTNKIQNLYRRSRIALLLYGYRMIFPFLFCQTPVLGLGLGVDFTFVNNNNNKSNKNKKNNKNPHLIFSSWSLTLNTKSCLNMVLALGIKAQISFLKTVQMRVFLARATGRRGNSGGSWEPSSQKLSELAEIIG